MTFVSGFIFGTRSNFVYKRTWWMLRYTMHTSNIIRDFNIAYYSCDHVLLNFLVHNAKLFNIHSNRLLTLCDDGFTRGCMYHLTNFTMIDSFTIHLISIQLYVMIVDPQDGNWASMLFELILSICFLHKCISEHILLITCMNEEIITSILLSEIATIN